MTAARALLALIAASTLLRLAWAASLGPTPNEAYYYVYTRHPDWSYLDHPPMVALVAALGMRLALSAPPLLGMRAAFIALFAGSTWLMARLTTRCFGERSGVLAALALNAAGYFGLVAGTSASPDGPLLFFWLLTLDRLKVALDPPGRASAWLGAGLAWGGAMLSKYYAALLPAGAVLFLILRPAARRCLATPGPYAATAVGLALFAPVIGWNAAHGWGSFLFQGWRAVGSPRLRPDRLVEAVAAQALFLFPWIWAAAAWALLRLLRRGPKVWGEPEAFLASQALPALLAFHGVALFRWIMPHWPLIGFVALLPMVGRAWADRLAARPGRQARRLAAVALAPIVAGTVVVAQARLGLLQVGGRLLGVASAESDPTLDLVGWDQVGRELARRGLLGRPGTFLVSDSWRRCAQLELAVRGRVPVACYARDARGYAYWSWPSDWLGRDAVFVADAGARVGDDITRVFARFEPMGPIEVVRAGSTVRVFAIYRGTRQLRPYPFGSPRAEPPGRGDRPQLAPEPHRPNSGRAFGRGPRPSLSGACLRSARPGASPRPSTPPAPRASGRVRPPVVWST
jgi:4-amino-4-deoxy-L-arabinose transferase-like glycosyltransferase